MNFADLFNVNLHDLFESLAHIAVVLLFGLVAWKYLIGRIAPRIVSALLWSHEGIETPEERAKREETLVHVLQGGIKVLLIFVVLFTVLGELGWT